MEYPEKNPGAVGGIKDSFDWPGLWRAEIGATAFMEAIRAGNVPEARPKYPAGEEINSLVAMCHGLSFAAGWYTNRDTMSVRKDFSVPEKLALIHSEISEALEADRKHLRDDKIPTRWGIEVELADALIRIFDLAGALNLDLGGAFEDKVQFNVVREDHLLSNRGGENGKAY